MEKTIQYRQTMFVFPATLIIHYFKGALFQIFLYGFLLFFSQELWMSLRLGIYLSILGVPGADSGARESLNGRKNMARRKVKNGVKSPWGQCLTRPVPNGRRRSAFCLGRKTQTFSGTNQKAELRPLSPPLSALGLRGWYLSTQKEPFLVYIPLWKYNIVFLNTYSSNNSFFFSILITITVKYMSIPFFRR